MSNYRFSQKFLQVPIYILLLPFLYVSEFKVLHGVNLTCTSAAAVIASTNSKGCCSNVAVFVDCHPPRSTTAAYAGLYMCGSGEVSSINKGHQGKHWYSVSACSNKAKRMLCHNRGGKKHANHACFNRNMGLQLLRQRKVHNGLRKARKETYKEHEKFAERALAKLKQCIKKTRPNSLESHKIINNGACSGRNATERFAIGVIMNNLKFSQTNSSMFVLSLLCSGTFPTLQGVKPTGTARNLLRAAAAAIRLLSLILHLLRIANSAGDAPNS